MDKEYKERIKEKKRRMRKATKERIRAVKGICETQLVIIDRSDAIRHDQVSSLEEALKVMEEWGYFPRSMGIGYYNGKEFSFPNAVIYCEHRDITKRFFEGIPASWAYIVNISPSIGSTVYDLNEFSVENREQSPQPKTPLASLNNSFLKYNV